MHEHTPEEKTLTHTSGADTAQPHAAAATSDGFSPIPDLFRKSWQMMTDAVLNALLLTITSGVLGFLVLVVALIAIVAVSVTQIDTSSFALFWLPQKQINLIIVGFRFHKK